MTIIDALERKAVGLRILNLGMDTQSPTGKLMLTVLGGVTQFEREMMLDIRGQGIFEIFGVKYSGSGQIFGVRVIFMFYQNSAVLAFPAFLP